MIAHLLTCSKSNVGDCTIGDHGHSRSQLVTDDHRMQRRGQGAGGRGEVERRVKARLGGLFGVGVGARFVWLSGFPNVGLPVIFSGKKPVSIPPK